MSEIKPVKTNGTVFYPKTVAAAVKDDNFLNNANEPMTLKEINTYLDDKIKDLESANDPWSNQVYGVVHYYENASPALVRIGNMDLHKSLPIQSLMRRCLVTDDGQVTYLHPENSNLLENGQPAVLDGSQGQVMVEIPEHYRKFTLNLLYKTYTCEMSLFKFAGAHKVNKCYISAYEASLNRTSLKLSSVVNNTTGYRGGPLNYDLSPWDYIYKNLLGRPITGISLTDFRSYANNRGSNWKCLEWDIHCAIFWLYTVEYANLNCQAPYNANLTNEGYRYGGLGSGVTNFNNWQSYFKECPFVPCGHTNSLGNYTGVLQYNFRDANGNVQYKAPVPSYRGIENPFGHIFKLVDGYLAKGAGNSTQDYYICRVRSDYANTLNNNYTYIGNFSCGSGYKKSIIRNLYGDIITAEVNGSSTTYFCDYFSQNLNDGKVYGVYLGGNAKYGDNVGFGCLFSNGNINYNSWDIGSRLCFCTKNRIIE